MRMSYPHDDDAQLESSLGFLYGGSPVADEQLEFGYDPGWNMTNRTVNATPVIYTVNDLNQVTTHNEDNQMQTMDCLQKCASKPPGF